MKRCIYLLTVAIFVIYPVIFAHGYDQESSMVKIRGTYGMSFGIETDELLWKEASGDYQENNWRYKDNVTDTVNTYDPRIFSRYQLEIETDTRTPWNGYAEIKIDPWSFVGIGEEMVYDEFGDFVTIEYKYWEATGKTINETYRTYGANFVDVPEIKVIGGKITEHTLISGFTDDEFESVLSKDRLVEIEYLFRPIRKLWVEYNEKPLYMKVFPIADQAEALSSDDPLRISNNHVYWAPSPWLFSFYPGMELRKTPGIKDGIDEAKWDWDLAWYAEDSNRQYLTFLRGITFGYKLEDVADLNITAASPMSLWDYYEDVNSIPIAGRLKFYPSGKAQAGLTYTSKYGLRKKDLRAFNHVLGFDMAYNLWDKTDIFGEFVVSYNYIEHPKIQKQRHRDQAYKAGVRSKLDFDEHNKLECDLNFALMGEHFYAGLADYKDTRIDREWGRHIWFDPLLAEDEEIRIGDSIDVNRYVIGLNAHANILDNMFDFYFNFRNAHRTDNSKFIENIVRLEAICNPVPDVQLKWLALHRKYPRSVGGYDPFIKDRYTDDPYVNDHVADGKDTDLMTFAGGAKLDLLDGKVSVYGICETTNDPQDFPRRELYNWNFVTGGVSVDEINFNRLEPYVYDQNIFDLPPYDFYNIWKGVIALRPRDDLSIKYTHVTNGNKNYAALFDSNHNHDAVEIVYNPLKDMDITLGYSRSRVIDLRRAMDTDGGDRPFRRHHNLYAQLDWNLKKDRRLTVQFGEAWLPEPKDSVFGPVWLSSKTSVLDTRKIFRVFYQGKF